jgi:hypothetical protein
MLQLFLDDVLRTVSKQHEASSLRQTVGAMLGENYCIVDDGLVI